MTHKMLQEIKKFAEENFCDENTDVYGDDAEFAVTNPWMDHSGRFELDDIGAIEEWGLDVVMDFCEKAKRKIEERAKDPVLCGFIFCHGKEDFSSYEIVLNPEDRKAIEEIINKYQNDGTSVRNAWDYKISDMYCDEY